MGRPYLIIVSSRKGGTGKTCVAVNLAVALASLNKKVLFFDADLDNGSATVYTGTQVQEGYDSDNVFYGLQDVGTAILKNAFDSVDMVPSIPYNILKSLPNETNIRYLMNRLQNIDYDFVIMDTSGVKMPQITTYFKRTFVVTTLNESSLKSTIVSIENAKSIFVKLDIIFNRIRDEDKQKVNEFESMNGKALAQLPEDQIVERSLIEHKPAFLLDRKAKFCQEIEKLANLLIKDAESSQSGSSMQI